MRRHCPVPPDIQIQLHRGPHGGDDHLAGGCRCRLRDMAARVAAVMGAMIRVDAVWLAVEPFDMRSGTEAALARVVNVFGAARPHHAYLFANRRGNRMKVLVHDGIGVWLAARRLNQGKFVWPRDGALTMTLTRVQLDALVLGLPWQRLGEAGIITVL
jgi:transposase